jgi:hypothetical protein
LPRVCADYEGAIIVDAEAPGTLVPENDSAWIGAGTDDEVELGPVVMGIKHQIRSWIEIPVANSTEALYMRPPLLRFAEKIVAISGMQVFTVKEYAAICSLEHDPERLHSTGGDSAQAYFGVMMRQKKSESSAVRQILDIGVSLTPVLFKMQESFGCCDLSNEWFGRGG